LFTIPDRYHIYKYIAIDPGINTCGFAIYTIDSENGDIMEIEAFTVHSSRLHNTTGYFEPYYSDRFIKLSKLKLYLVDLVRVISPVVVVCEAPFYNPSRPGAYGSLVELVGSFQQAVCEFNSNIFFTSLPPMSVKKEVNASTNNQDKQDVKAGVSKIQSITSALVNTLDELDDHAIDAIAVGYAYYILKLA
jgi:Holliday junction resolvasome RuvABC endonuclease subunit